MNKSILQRFFFVLTVSFAVAAVAASPANHQRSKKMARLPASTAVSAVCTGGDTTPPCGTITDSSATPVTFTDNAPGTAADSEPDAISGVNKNTFVLTVAAG